MCVYIFFSRGIIEAIFELNKKNITQGYPRSEDIMTGGADEEVMTTWLTNPPETNNPAGGEYISNFIFLVKHILGITDDSELPEDSELTHFLEMTESTKTL